MKYILVMDLTGERVRWLNKFVGYDNWDIVPGATALTTVLFRNREDCIAVKLKWSEVK